MKSVKKNKWLYFFNFETKIVVHRTDVGKSLNLSGGQREIRTLGRVTPSHP